MRLKLAQGKNGRKDSIINYQLAISNDKTKRKQEDITGMGNYGVRN